MAEKIIRMGLSLLVSIYVVRYLGPERFGVLSFALSFVGLFTAISGLGLDGVIVRNLVEKPEQRDVILGTAFILKVLGALLMWLSILAAIPFTINDNNANVLIAIIAFSAIFQSFNVIDFFNQAAVQARYTVKSQLIQLLVSGSLQIIFVLKFAPLVWFAWIYVIDAAILAFGLWVGYKFRNKKIFKWQWSFLEAKKLLIDSWPLVFAGVVVSIYMKIDQVMIKEMLGTQAVGYYAAAVKLSEAWYFIPMAICSSLFPAVVEAKKNNQQLFIKRIKLLYFTVFWLAFVVALPVTFVSPWIIDLFYGSSYVQSAKVLQIHIWAGLFVALGVASSSWLLSENLQKLSLYRTLIGSIINVGLNIILIPSYGIEGAALATLISYAVATFTLVIFKQSRQHSWVMIKAVLKHF